jgi:dihydroflavonol-4-reductase
MKHVYRNIFVTGGSGFIGSNLILELVRNNYTVSALMREGSSHPLLEAVPYKKMQGDLFSHDVLDIAIKDCDVVIHCAAVVSFDEKNWRETYHVNVTGSENILKAALKHQKKVVFVSTASTCGAPQQHPQIMDETTQYSFKEKNPYTHSKHIAEKHLQQYVKKGLDAIIVNPSTVYGKGDINGTGAALYTLMEKYPIFVAPPGGCSVIAVQDVVAGIIAALTKGKKGEKYILTAENISYYHLFMMLRKTIRKSTMPLMKVPKFVESPCAKILQLLKMQSNIITPSVLSYLFNYRYLDNSKAKRVLGWKPQMAIEQAIEEGYTFYMKERQARDNGNKQ